MGDIINFDNHKKEKEFSRLVRENGLNDKLDEGILTFDRIYDYYISHEEFSFGYNLATLPDLTEEKVMEMTKDHNERMRNIRKILSIKKYSKESQMNYLLVARDIISKRKITEELDDISKLTKFFFENKENIDNIELSDIKKIINKGKEKVLKDEN